MTDDELRELTNLREHNARLKKRCAGYGRRIAKIESSLAQMVADTQCILDSMGDYEGADTDHRDAYHVLLQLHMTALITAKNGYAPGTITTIRDASQRVLEEAG